MIMMIKLSLTHCGLLWVLVNIGSDIEGLAQDCSNSSVLAMELLQSCAKPSIWSFA